jgi:hypothetical protein
MSLDWMADDVHREQLGGRQGQPGQPPLHERVDHRENEEYEDGVVEGCRPGGKGVADQLEVDDPEVAEWYEEQAQDKRTPGHRVSPVPLTGPGINRLRPPPAATGWCL